MTPLRDIYFAGSITGGRDDAAFYRDIIELLRPYGKVLSEHIGSATLDALGEVDQLDIYVHDRDCEWIEQSQVLVAEVTTPSTGAGYEIGRAVMTGKRVLCLYRELPGRRLTRMLSGNSAITVRAYRTIDDVPAILEEFFGPAAAERD